ncbi:ABC transporter ATP-binding protein [Dysosmobacter sp.]|uniref:ABC transporter ATP-binding protein n=1 Tax=Dysosmobacter sp. TaxID=2591382 RepID=UPI002A863C31|nr:ABC transporter ATP-binding protein [Dysosmobacter sp.]MDY3281741.1 ABC transporter ATP-binding protein [Dysosmobacter sp.]
MIQLKDLSAGYGSKPIVDRVTLDFLPGQVLVLLGPNGSGKSTLLKAALGLLPAMGGQVLFDGAAMASLTRRQIARKAAFLSQSRPQSSILALRMVLHGRFPYLSYPRRYSREDYAIARRAMDAAGVRAYENTNVSRLSGGQRQGVYLAMALAQDTETILMDEPTTYLDIHRQLQVMDTARALAGQGKAVVLVLHDIPLALRGADRIALLESGRLACCGTPEEVYAGGALDRVFGVAVHRVDTPHGPQYYCTEKEEA